VTAIGWPRRAFPFLDIDSAIDVERAGDSFTDANGFGEP
jgi:hypothetical protein